MILDERIFMVSMMPIMLKSEGEQISKNPHSSSTKSCIPVEFQYAKKTPELTRSIIGWIKEEISQLLHTKVVFRRFRCQVSYKLFLTMLDGKTAQNLNSTLSAAACHLCEANSSEMNELTMNDFMQTAKSRIQQDFRKEVGLVIDSPRQGAGNLNDRSTTRRFFFNPELTSQITGVDSRLIQRFSIILQVLSGRRRIDAAKCEPYAFQTAQLYVEL